MKTTWDNYGTTESTIFNDQGGVLTPELYQEFFERDNSDQPSPKARAVTVEEFKSWLENLIKFDVTSQRFASEYEVIRVIPIIDMIEFLVVSMEIVIGNNTFDENEVTGTINVCHNEIFLGSILDLADLKLEMTKIG